MQYDVVIGLEVHAELKTKTKCFCSCENQYGDLPNSNCCPVCMGLPGALPVLNKFAVEQKFSAAALDIAADIFEHVFQPVAADVRLIEI